MEREKGANPEISGPPQALADPVVRKAENQRPCFGGLSSRFYPLSSDRRNWSASIPSDHSFRG
jgi:hypothetical protein